MRKLLVAPARLSLSGEGGLGLWFSRGKAGGLFRKYTLHHTLTLLIFVPVHFEH